MAATKTNGKPPVDVEEEEGEDVSVVVVVAVVVVVIDDVVVAASVVVDVVITYARLNVTFILIISYSLVLREIHPYVCF